MSLSARQTLASNGKISFPTGLTLGTDYAADMTTSRGLPIADWIAQRIAHGTPLEDAVLAAAVQFPHFTKLFEFDPARVEATFALRSELKYPRDSRPVRAVIKFSGTGRNLPVQLGGDDALLTVSALAACASGAHTFDDVIDLAPAPSQALLQSLRSLLITPPKKPAFELSAPGLYRLQHATLFFRSATTGLLVDPHFASSYEPSLKSQTFSYGDVGHLTDAILISHSHLDHFHLPTLLMFPRSTPIFVPKVPRNTILALDMAALLKQAGFTDVRALDWYAPESNVGDFKINVLPFYGEQPLLRERPASPDVRNWGNTYLVESPRFRSWVLIDSGADAAGSMIEVAERIRARFGPIDLVLSNLREFYCRRPDYISGGSYWLTLNGSQIKRFHEMNGDLITLGPTGVAEVCRAVGAKNFLPYAHWWAELNDLAAIEGEVDNVARLRAALMGAPTEVLSWTVGEFRDFV